MPGNGWTYLILGRTEESVDQYTTTVTDTFGDLVDRAYVANNGNDTMSIVDVVGRSPVGLARILADDFQGLTDLQVETMAASEASQLLFLVSPNRERILRYELSGVGVDGDNPFPEGDFIVGPSPRRVAL